MSIGEQIRRDVSIGIRGVLRLSARVQYCIYLYLTQHYSDLKREVESTKEEIQNEKHLLPEQKEHWIKLLDFLVKQ